MKVYASGAGDPPATRVKVGIADYAVTAADEELATSGLGSCIAVAVYDAPNGVAGLAHAMLPRAADGADSDAGAKFVDTATAALLRDVRAAGGSLDSARAKLVGGSEMFAFSTESVGPRNVEAAKRALADGGVRVVASDVGGDYGRSVRLRGSSGELVVRSARRGERAI